MRIGVVLLAVVAGAIAQDREQLKRDYKAAWALAGQQRFDEAIPLLQELIARDRAFYPAYRTLGEAYRGKKDFGAAEEFFGSLVAQDPSNGLAYYGLGCTYSSHGAFPSQRAGANDARATENFACCIRASPEAVDCYVRLVMAATARQRQPVRLEELKSLIPYDLRRPETYLAVAGVYGFQHRWPEQLEAVRTGLALARQVHRPELQALLHAAAAVAIHADNGDPNELLAYHLEAIRMFEEIGDWDTHVGLFISSGGAYRLARDFDRLFDWARRAYDFVRTLEHPVYRLQGTRNIAFGYLSGGDLEKAEEHFAESVGLARSLGEPGHLTNTLIEMGRIYRLQGEYSQGLECYAEARAIAARRADAHGEAFAVRGMGVLEGQRGNYFKWLEHERESVRIFESDGARWQAGAGLGNIGNIYAALGDYASALEYYRRSLASAREFHDRSEQQGNLDNIGTVYLGMDRPGEALPYLVQAAGLATDTASYQANVRLDLARAYTALGRHAEAIKSAEASVNIARRSSEKPPEAAALAQLGNCNLAAGNLEAAERSFTAALELAEPRRFASAIIAARRGLGETWRRKGAYRRSLEHFREAIKEIEAVRNRVPSPEVRAGVVRENWKAYESAIEVLGSLDDRSPGQGFDREAFQFSERARARSFLELLVESRAQVTKGLSQEDAARRRSLLAAISKASEALLKQPSATNKLALATAERRLQDWAMGLRNSNRAYQELEYPEPYTAERVQSEVAVDGDTVIEYALGERQSRVWLIDRDRILMKRLPGRAVIPREVRAYRRLLASRPKDPAQLAAVWTLAHRLYDLLLAPLRPYLRRERGIIIIPDGVLHYLPFETLPDNAPMVLGSPRYLIEEFPVAYAPSATVFASLAQMARAADTESQRRELLAYGDPVFSATAAPKQPSNTGDLVRGVYGSRGISFPALPNTRIEVESISALFPPGQRTTYLGREATEVSVKNQPLRQYRRIHFATHSLVDERIPARSGVVLSLVDAGEDDGILQLHEIVNLDLDADLVVLSACQTGLGQFVKGEGLVGLTRAFLFAGTPRVVVSLWKVDDVGTAGLMKTFYAKMREGKSPAAALREAKLAMIHSGVGAWQRPFFWAPFVLVGLF